MCEKTFSNGKLANQVILVKYRISVSDTPKVARVHGIHLVKLLSKRKKKLKPFLDFSIQSVTIDNGFLR